MNEELDLSENKRKQSKTAVLTEEEKKVCRTSIQVVVNRNITNNIGTSHCFGAEEKREYTF